MDPVIQLGKAIGMSKVRKMLTQALDHGIESVPDAPKELVSLFSHLDRKPEWFNEDDYERGRIALANASPIGRLVGLAMTFLVTAQAGSVANAVGSTAQYTRTSTVIRRHVETAHFFHRVSLPGGSARFSETFQEIVKVRVMHAQVRAAAKKRWGPAVLAIHGNPISDADVALGITAFGVQKLIGDCAFGRRFSSQDLDATVRYWGYIGYVMGVSEDIIPRNFLEGVEEMDYILSSHGAPPDWSPRIADSLLLMLEEPIKLADSAIKRWMFRAIILPFFHGLLYHFSGDELGYRFLSVRYKSRVCMRMTAFYAVIVAQFIVCLWTLGDLLPGREAQVRKQAVEGGRGEKMVLDLLQRAAKKIQHDDCMFTTHDQSVPSELGAVRI